MTQKQTVKLKCPVCKKDNIRINPSRVYTCSDCGHNADKDIFEFEGDNK